MSKTIEERMEDLARSAWRSSHGDAASFHHQEDLKRAIIADCKEIAAAAKNAIEEIEGIMCESQGVVGWHLNGALALWSEFTDDDGLGLERLRAAIAEVTDDRE